MLSSGAGTPVRMLWLGSLSSPDPAHAARDKASTAAAIPLIMRFTSTIVDRSGLEVKKPTRA